MFLDPRFWMKNAQGVHYLLRKRGPPKKQKMLQLIIETGQYQMRTKRLYFTNDGTHQGDIPTYIAAICGAHHLNLVNFQEF